MFVSKLFVLYVIKLKIICSLKLTWWCLTIVFAKLDNWTIEFILVGDVVNTWTNIQPCLKFLQFFWLAKFLVFAWVWMTHSLILPIFSNFFIAFKPKCQIAMMARSHVGELLSMVSTLPWSMSWGCQILTLHKNGLSKCVVHTSPHQRTSHNNNQQCKKVKDYWHKCFDL